MILSVKSKTSNAYEIFKMSSFGTDAEPESYAPSIFLWFPPIINGFIDNDWLEIDPDLTDESVQLIRFVLACWHLVYSFLNLTQTLQSI
jgi:hypothetical protein